MSGVVASIDLNALRHNLLRVRQSAPGRKIMAVVKADAYGHGAAQVAPALGGADAFGVARVGEGVGLRRAGVQARIVVLGGITGAEELSLALADGLDTVVHHASQVRMLDNLLRRGSAGLRCWIKVDTGMHRLGVRPEMAEEVVQALRRVPGAVPCGVMTHLANADSRKDPTTTDQVSCFRPVAAALGLPTSIGNSAAILGWPEAHGEWVRPGIMLYGASPFTDSTAVREGLRPVMTFGTRLIAINDCRRGEVIGYGGTWRCPEDMPVGIAAVGYGDGYPRHAPSGTPVVVSGQRAALVGRVSMDTIAVDLRDVAQARVGDPVVLWGEGLPAEEVAASAGTIAYELFCRLTRRVRFLYHGAEEAGTA